MATIEKWKEEARKRGFKSVKEWLSRTYDSASVSQIAEDVGLSKSGTHKLLQRFGVELRSRGGPNR